MFILFFSYPYKLVIIFINTSLVACACILKISLIHIRQRCFVVRAGYACSVFVGVNFLFLKSFISSKFSCSMAGRAGW